MQNLIDFTGKILERVELGISHNEPHPAWQDDTNVDYLICYEVLLSFQEKSSCIIQPCEIDLPERYPSLGLMAKESKSAEMHSPLSEIDLPSKVVHIEQTDFLGEDVINQYKLTLQNKQTLIIRHVFPPMTMGVKVER